MLLALKSAILPIYNKIYTTTFDSRQHNTDF